MKGLKTINDWSHKLFADRLVLRKHVERFLLPELELIIDESLCYTVKVIGSFLVEDHDLYLRHRRSIRDVTVSVLVKELEEYKLCGGVNACEMTSKLYHHVIPLNPDLWWMRTTSSYHTRDVGEPRAACSCVNKTLCVQLVPSTWCPQEILVMQRRGDNRNLPMLRHRCPRQTQKKNLRKQTLKWIMNLAMTFLKFLTPLTMLKLLHS